MRRTLQPSWRQRRKRSRQQFDAQVLGWAPNRAQRPAKRSGAQVTAVVGSFLRGGTTKLPLDDGTPSSSNRNGSSRRCSNYSRTAVPRQQQCHGTTSKHSRLRCVRQVVAQLQRNSKACPSQGSAPQQSQQQLHSKASKLGRRSMGTRCRVSRAYGAVAAEQYQPTA